MPLLRAKTTVNLLQDMAKNLAAVEAVFQQEDLPKELRKKVRRFVRRTNWRRLLYLRFYPTFRPARILAWLTDVSNALDELNSNCRELKVDPRIRRNCYAILEKFEEDIETIEDTISPSSAKIAS